MPSTHIRIAAAATALLTSLGMSGLAAGTATAAASVKTVNCNGDGNLQAALDAGGTVTVSGVCTGNFSITKNVTITGSPSATLDGGGLDTVLNIAPSLKVTLSHIAVEDGFGGGNGGGISVGAETHLLLSHVTVSHNHSYGSGAGLATNNNAVVTADSSSFSFNNSALSNNTPVDLSGGAISSAGTLVLDHSSFTDNTVTANSENSSAAGGAVYVDGKLEVTDSTFARNAVRGTTAQGGSIYAFGASIKIVNSTFTDDKAVGVDPAAEQAANGGSVYSMATTNSMQGVHITGSRAEVNGPLDGQALGGGAMFFEPATISGSVFSGDAATGATTGNNTEAFAEGGGLLLEQDAATTIRRTTLENNTATASAAQGSAYAEGGGVFALGQLDVSSSTISGNKVAAASGVMASGIGGGVMTLSQVHPATLTNSTITANTSTATLSNGAGPTAIAAAAGGGVEDESVELRFRFDTVASNSTHGATGSQGGGVDLPSVVMEKPLTFATIWSGNRAQTGPQCAGGFTSSGSNLFGALSDCPTTTTNADRTHGPARLASLASNGGPTKTMALKAGSAALNQVPRARCLSVVKADQRGVSRPQGAAKKASRRRCDIGAYERTVHHKRR
jgi:hypothetical protein